MWTGLVPLIGIFYVFRLVQYYRLKPEVIKAAATGAVSGELLVDFQNSCSRLWLAVLLWPALIALTFLALLLTLFL